MEKEEIVEIIKKYLKEKMSIWVNEDYDGNVSIEITLDGEVIDSANLNILRNKE